MVFKLPEPVASILNQLTDAGYEAHIVGGCVRDFFLFKTPKDWDICTNAKPDEILNVFKDYEVIPTGIKHGTVTVMLYGVGYEVTTYRTDGTYSDGRHPDSVEFVSNLFEDLARRDFTMNALAYSEKEGFIDLFGGIQDINKGIIRCVGNPVDRFNEDALRIMRALRFSAELGFRIELDTSEAIFNQYENLRKIAKERINIEFSKMLMGWNAITVLTDYQEIIMYILSNRKRDDTINYAGYMKALGILSHSIYECNLNSILTILLYNSMDRYEYVSDFLQYLRYDKDTQKEVLLLTDNYSTDYSFSNNNKIIIRHMVCNLGKKSFIRLLKVQMVDAYYNKDKNRIKKIEELLIDIETFDFENECCSLTQLKIDGNDLIQMGFKGEVIGRILNIFLFDVMNEEIPNDRDFLLKDLARIKKVMIYKMKEGNKIECSSS